MPRECVHLEDLVELVARLRAEDGCPWDREQRLADVRAYLVEEAHEVAAAIDRGDWDELAGELGDLLFQVAFVLQLAAEQGRFGLADVVARSGRKMVDRHPHVFGGEPLPDAATVRAAWERRKSEGGRPLLAGIPDSLPALTGAHRIGQKAAAVGFDWPDRASVMAKVEEELDELRTDLDRDVEGAREELGDLLFAIANLGRHLGVDPEAALAAANAKFRRRFGYVEERLRAEGRTVGDATLDELEELWGEAKRGEGS